MTTPALPTDVAVVWTDHVGSDWIGIYVDGDRVYEGHPPDPDDLLRVLGIDAVQRVLHSDSLRVPGRMGLPLRLPREVPA